MPTAVLTGASRGLGLALARALSGEGWRLVLDARDADALAAAAPSGAVLVPGDVTDPLHRAALAAAAGPVDLLVNNASLLGPLVALSDLDLAAYRQVLETDLVAPLALVQELRPAAVVNISSDAGVEGYETWGGYGSAKAGLDHLTAVLRAEGVRAWSFDPGDLRTAMHQEAFPGEDISDRPLPESVVPAFLRLLALPPGRYRAADLLTAVAR